MSNLKANPEIWAYWRMEVNAEQQLLLMCLNVFTHSVNNNNPAWRPYWVEFESFCWVRSVIHDLNLSLYPSERAIVLDIISSGGPKVWFWHSDKHEHRNNNNKTSLNMHKVELILNQQIKKTPPPDTNCDYHELWVFQLRPVFFSFLYFWIVFFCLCSI